MEKTTYATPAQAAEVLESGPLGGVWPARVLWVLSLMLVASVLLFELLTPGFLLPVERPITILVVASCLLALAGSTVGALFAQACLATL